MARLQSKNQISRRTLKRRVRNGPPSLGPKSQMSKRFVLCSSNMFSGQTLIYTIKMVGSIFPYHFVYIHVSNEYHEYWYIVHIYSMMNR